MAVSSQTKGGATELLVFQEAWREQIEEAASKLQEAIEFLDLCRKSPGATETGALRDAHQWVEANARNLIHAIYNFDSRKW